MTGVLNIQISPNIGDKKSNLEKIEHYIEANSDKKLDLVVMPEFFSTGISHDAFEKFPEDENGGEVIENISKLAQKYKTNIIAGTVIEKSDGKYYNTSFALDRNGKIIAKYRKIHLFNYMGGNEGELITPGEEKVVADMDFGKVGLSVCFDIRYPQMFRELARMGAEMIVLPTAWVIPNEVYNDGNSLNYAQDMWLAMNRTRAYDNMVYTVISNQCAQVNDKVSSLGNSMIISPLAEVITRANLSETALYADVDLTMVKLLKSQYPITSIE